MIEALSLSDNIVPLFALLCGGICAVTWLLSSHFRKTQMAEMETALKMEMIQRGLSADEIERILSAKMSTQQSPAKAA